MFFPGFREELHSRGMHAPESKRKIKSFHNGQGPTNTLLTLLQVGSGKGNARAGFPGQGLPGSLLSRQSDFNKTLGLTPSLLQIPVLQ